MENIEDLTMKLNEVLSEKDKIIQLESELKKKLIKHMMSNDIHVHEDNSVKVTLKPAFNRSTLNMKTFEYKYPDVYFDESLYKTVTVEPCLMVRRKVKK